MALTSKPHGPYPEGKVHAYTLGAALGSVIYNLCGAGLQNTRQSFRSECWESEAAANPLLTVDRGVGGRFWGLLRPLGMLIVLLDWGDPQQKGAPLQAIQALPGAAPLNLHGRAQTQPCLRIHHVGYSAICCCPLCKRWVINSNQSLLPLFTFFSPQQPGKQ